MRIATATFISVALATVGLSLGGCGLVSVDMTSTPSTVKHGDPVSFDIKLTNQSQCPLETSGAVLIPFISERELQAAFSQIPPNAPPEILAFIDALRMFLDELCSGGSPTPPTFPAFATGPAVTSGTFTNRLSGRCHLDGSDLACEIDGRVSGGNGMTFPLLGDRLECSIDDGIVRCLFHIALSPGAAPAAVAAAAISPLTCLTPQQLGAPNDQEFGAVCFLGTFPMITGLGPAQMAEGQITLPAHGAGVVRNLVFAFSPNPDEAGVCKSGTSAGQACDVFDSASCPGSTCGEGICVGGDRPNDGCDVAMQATDCPNGGTCKACNDVPQSGFLPLDCTTTYVSPEPAPVMSQWGLLATAAVLLMLGTWWVERRRERR